MAISRLLAALAVAAALVAAADLPSYHHTPPRASAVVPAEHDEVDDPDAGADAEDDTDADAILREDDQDGDLNNLDVPELEQEIGNTLTDPRRRAR